jgi:hypothetical protein
MFAAYVTVTILTATANAYAAYLSFSRHKSVIAVVQRLHVRQSWMVPFGTTLASGALGLLVGFAVPLIGTAAAVGLVLYFVGAVTAHLRVRDYQLGNVTVFLALAVATLVVGLAYRGPW